MQEEQITVEENQVPPARKKKKGKGILLLIIILVIIGVVAFLFLKTDVVSKVSDKVGGEDVIATVDGVNITESQIEDRIARNRDALAAGGTDVDDPATREALEAQLLEQIINEELVLADASVRGIVVTDEEIEEQLIAIRGRFETDEEFSAELEKNRFTEETLRANVERELTIQKYVQQVANSQPIEITEEEILAVYDQLALENEELPSLEELSPQIENQLRNQQLSQVIDGVVTELREGADIVIIEEEEAAEPEA